MNLRTRLAIAALVLLAACTTAADGPMVPTDHRAADTVPVDTTTGRGPGTMGGGG